ncbi:MAG: hypothetical protein JWM41_607 [Gemmatimonadetes bacterium]|nr:hypothetical protein [Gemmatimonadota bacterium]
MRAWVVATLLAAVLGVAVSGVARGQRIDDGRAGVVSRRAADVTPPDSSAVREHGLRVPVRALPYAPLVSAIVPGGGQFMLGDDRFVAYAAVELLGWLKYAKDTREQAVQEASFRDLARRVARSSFSSAVPDGDWTYYESMRDWKASGFYSASAAGPVVPETDQTTFNGYQWNLALHTNPDTASALAQYERLAYKPEFRWDWTNAQLQYDIFKRTTFKRDDAHYAAIQDLIVLGANHVLSMVDAFATFRLSAHTDPTGRTSVGGRLRW